MVIYSCFDPNYQRPSVSQKSLEATKENYFVDKNLYIPILFLIILTSCINLSDENQTQIPIRPTQTPFQTSGEMLPIGDGGLISGQPCEAPCFFGIIPGETSQDKAVYLLEEQGFHQCSQDSENNIVCNERILIGLNSSTSIVDGIGYVPDSTLSVEEIIAKYGNPDIITVTPSGIPEAPATTVLLFFDRLNMRIRLPEVLEVDYLVTNSSKVELITYFDGTHYSAQKDGMFSQPWIGYGAYKP